MATKKEVFESAEALIKKHNTPAAFNTELLALLEVKTGGGSFNIDEVAVLNAEGKPVFILDSIFNKWVAVLDHDGADVFYVKPDTTLGYSRWARVSESTRKQADKVFKTTKDAVFKDLMSGTIDQPAAQKLMEQAEKIKAGLAIPAKLCGRADKPTLADLPKVHAEMKAIAAKEVADEAAAKAKAKADEDKKAV